MKEKHEHFAAETMLSLYVLPWVLAFAYFVCVCVCLRSQICTIGKDEHLSNSNVSKWKNNCLLIHYYICVECGVKSVSFSLLRPFVPFFFFFSELNRMNMFACNINKSPAKWEQQGGRRKKQKQ